MAKKPTIDTAEKRGLSRRDFLTGLTFLGGGIAASSLLGGCSDDGALTESAAAENIVWDQEADIVVAGGAMSLFAALYAHLKGEDVLVIEKNSVLGGTAAFSGGSTWLPLNGQMLEQDTREDAIKTIKKTAEGSSTDELIEAFVDGSESFYNWTIDELDFPWKLTIEINEGWDSWERYQPVDGFKKGRVLKIDSTVISEKGTFSGGPAMFVWLVDKCDEVGLPYQLNTAARRLITDNEGQVIGVEAEKGSDPIFI